MKRVLLFVLALLPLTITAQQYEVGLLFGGSAYQGDLSPKVNSLSSSDVNASLGIFGRYNVNPYLTAKLNFTYGKLTGSDANSNDAGRQARNLDFSSNLYELGLVGEINLFGFNPEKGKRFSPYIFGGVAVFKYKPEANYNGQLIELQPLGTEGQGMEGFGEKYNLTQVSIPFGAGVKYAINDRLNIGVEMGFRKTFTDYIDDVSGTYVSYVELLNGNGELAAVLGDRSGELLPTDTPSTVRTGDTRGNAANDDWYAVGGLTISYSFYGSRNGLGRKGKNDLGCPKF